MCVVCGFLESPYQITPDPTLNTHEVGPYQKTSRVKHSIILLHQPHWYCIWKPSACVPRRRSKKLGGDQDLHLERFSTLAETESTEQNAYMSSFIPRFCHSNCQSDYYLSNLLASHVAQQTQQDKWPMSRTADWNRGNVEQRQRR